MASTSDPMPFFLDPGHYQEIVHLLTAGDVRARVRFEGETDARRVYSVEVDLADGLGLLVWRNCTPFWSCTRYAPTTGKVLSNYPSQIGWMATSEVVAEAIALAEVL